ncbi:MAG: tetratricopeptide repeat protein [bacterium]|nr:tetratricopeptide repeat protein [bacterium]
MKSCPKCQSEFDNNEIQFCSFCGTSLESGAKASNENEDDSDLDFVVTESASSGPEFVGGAKKFQEDEDLEIQSPNDCNQSDSKNSSSDERVVKSNSEEDVSPIGETAPIMPGSEYDQSGLDTARNEIQDETDEKPRLKKLSDEDVKSITSDLYGSSEYLSKSEKGDLLAKLSAVDKPAAFPGSRSESKNNLSPAEKKETLSEPKMAPQLKGAAFFYKNYVELQGVQNLHAGDEVTYEGRQYTLSPKNLNNRWTWGVGGTLFAILLLFIGSMFISDSTSLNGQIAGLVLDINGAPFIHGAEIRIPEIGRTIESNGQGLFTAEDLNTGSYKIECFIDDKLMGSEIATVSEGLTTTVTIRPVNSYSNSQINTKATRTADKSEATPPEPVVNAQLAVAETVPEPALEPKQKTVQKSQEKSSTKNSGPGKIVLAANVENARLVLDGKTMGAGNLTYSSISAGTHKYSITADGYQEAAGTVKVKSGEKKKLSVTLTPLATAAKAKEYGAEDYYYSASNAAKTEDYQTAISDFTKAIELNPAYATAYFYRGDAHLASHQVESAHDDFLRAAEQFQFQKKYSDAVTAYNRALEADDNSIVAYLGRGNLYLFRNEQFAAIADFESAVKLDERNFQAQYGLGKARFQQDNFKKAIDHFKKAQSLDKNDPLVHQYLMLSYLARDDFKKVRKAFDDFKDVASDEQMARFKADNKYSAVLQVVENN